MPPPSRLMLVTDRRSTRGRPLVPIVRRAVEGGVGLVQVREKDLDDSDLDALVKEIRRAVGERARVIVNGHSRVARHTHGLHLSASELPLPAHRWDDDEWLVGRSAADENELALALEEGVSYVVVRDVFTERPDHGAGERGLERLRLLARAARPTPVFAAGGLTVTRVPEAVHAGAWGVAVGAAMLSATHPGRVAQAMTVALEIAGMPEF